jgi:N-acetylneuraminic acid mutarotase
MDTEAYDPAIDTWEVKSPILPGERYLHAVVAYNGKIYVIGGDSYEYGYNEVWNDIQEYDPIIDCWTKKSPMPDSATGLDAVAINGKIYVFGGNGLARQYDIATDAWQELTSDQDSIDSFSVCLYNNEVYRFGGGGWGPTSNIVESADLR